MGRKGEKLLFDVIFRSTNKIHYSDIAFRPISSPATDFFKLFSQVQTRSKPKPVEESGYRIMAGFKGYPKILRDFVSVTNGVLGNKAYSIERERNMLE